jgi:hypothetical protein
MNLLLSDVLRGMLPNNGQGIVDARECFGCGRKVFIGRCQAMDDSCFYIIPAFSRHVTILIEFNIYVYFTVFTS